MRHALQKVGIQKAGIWKSVRAPRQYKSQLGSRARGSMTEI